MDLSKFPFSKNRANEQLTPDLLNQEKAKQPPEKKELAPDKQVEKIPAAKDKQELPKAEVDIPVPQALPKKVAPAAKSVPLKKIENILQEDLEEIFFNMDEAHRRMFKAQGERVAIQIEKIIATGKSITVKVLEIIKQWLRLIPGVNKFFIEQEAKIKTDKIIKINQVK